MEANDEALVAAPVPVRVLLALIVNAVIPVIVKTVKTAKAIQRAIFALEQSTPLRDAAGQASMTIDELQPTEALPPVAGSSGKSALDPQIKPEHNPAFGYLLRSLPKPAAALMGAEKEQDILGMVNRAIAAQILDPLRKKLEDANSALRPDAVGYALVREARNSGLLATQDTACVDTCHKVLQSQAVVAWVLQAARATAVLDNVKRAEKKAAAPAIKKPVPTITKTAAKPGKTSSQPTTNTNNPPKKGNGGKKVSPINIIGKIKLPKDIFSLLKLGANYTIEWAQKAPAASREELNKSNFNKFDFNSNFKQEMLRKYNLTVDCLTELENFFEFLAGVCKTEPEEFWLRLIQQDTEPSEINLSLFDIIKKGKFAAPMGRLDDFLKSRQIIAKMADKNAGLTLMHQTWYDKHLKEHLKSGPYKQLDKGYCVQYHCLSNLHQLCEKHEVDFKTWYPGHDKADITTPLIYIMPKIHKTPIGFRPIIPSHSWYTTKAAKYLHNKFLPLLKKAASWVLMDRLKLIHDLENYTVEAARTHLATIDVTAMYTSIPIKNGLKVVRQLCHDFKFVPEEELDYLMDLASWVLDNNYFQYDGKWYKQTTGAAMGGNFSGVFADLVLAGIELEIGQVINSWSSKEKPLKYYRYRDDILLIAPSARTAPKVARLLESRCSLKFNVEQYGDRVNYLDLTIYKGDKFKGSNMLDLQPYIKPTNNRDYVHYTTYKPEMTKTSWITGESIRILRACQNAKEFGAQMMDFRKRLTKSGYPQKVIRSKLKYRFNDRNWLIEKQEKLDAKFYSMENSRHAHERWNFIQNNFGPLLEFHNVKLTASKGKTLLDVMNKATKTLLEPKEERQQKRAQLHLAIARNRELHRAVKKISKRKAKFLSKSFLQELHKQIPDEQLAHQLIRDASTPNITLNDTETLNAVPKLGKKPSRRKRLDPSRALSPKRKRRKRVATDAMA